MRSTWTKRRVGVEIRKLKRAGHPLNVRAVKARTVHWHARRLFGSWGEAIRAAGLDYDKIRRYRSWTKALILKWIRRQWRAGRDIRPGLMQDDEPRVFAAACRRFGGWYPALRAAGVRGIEERTPRRWDVKTLIKALRAFGPEAHGTDIRAKDPGLLAALVKRFGSFSRARKAAGYAPNLPRRRPLWPRERVLEVIRERAATHPGLRTRDFSDLGGMWAAAIDIFGSWPNAVRAAGCSYTEAGHHPRRNYADRGRLLSRNGLHLTPR
jgi:hypothetical protein